MNLRIMPGRVAVKKHKVKLKGVIQLPEDRRKIYDIGMVTAVGNLLAYGPEGKISTKETFTPGELVLFQLPEMLFASRAFDIRGEFVCFLHVEDIIAKLKSDVIDFESFQIVGRFLLLQPTVRNPSSLIITPDNAEEAKKENIHFSVLQTGLDVKETFGIGQEVFPDKGRVNPMGLDRKEFVFVDQQFIYGALTTD